MRTFMRPQSMPKTAPLRRIQEQVQGSVSGILWCTLLCLLLGCGGRTVLIVDSIPAPPPPALPGVDSVFIKLAMTYAQRGGVIGEEAVQDARRSVQGGRHLLDIADSLTRHLDPDADSVQVTLDMENEAIRRFNAGAEALQSETPGLQELQAAADQFQLALAANPYDAEASYWLSRVYELQYERLGEAGAVRERVDVLRRLTELHPESSYYASLLAEAFEPVRTVQDWKDAGAWWHRAAGLAQDEYTLSLDAEAVLDTAIVFFYLANASRAFIEADEADLALAALVEAEPFAVEAGNQDYMQGEKDWILWDEVLWTRKQYDSLLVQGGADPAGAASGLEGLLNEVTNPIAKLEVEYQLGLMLHNAGDPDAGIIRLSAVWREVAPMTIPLRERVQEDYGLVAYTIARQKQSDGDLRAAMAYLLQSEATGFSQSPQVALTLSLLLRNDTEASLEAAQRAEAGWEGLEPADRQILLEHMVDIHRRRDDRDQALLYAERYRAFVSAGVQ